MHQLTTKQRAMIAQMSIERRPYRQIMKVVGCSRQSVVRWKNTLQNSCSFKNKQGSGRKSKITPKIIKKLINTTKGKRKRSTRSVSRILKQKNIINLSHTTVHNVLRNQCLHPYKRRPKPKLEANHITQRRKWLRQTANTNWDNVVFSDEKIFYVSKHPNKKNDVVWAADPSEVLPAEVISHSQKVHVWAGICSRGKTYLSFIEGNLNAEEYIKILKKTLLPRINELYNGEDWVFMQDHASSHDADITQTWLKENVPQFYDKDSWPAKSPDLNPIENLWSILEANINRDKLTSKKSLKNAIKKVWNNISLSQIIGLIHSMKNRRSALRKANGGHTKY